MLIFALLCSAMLDLGSMNIRYGGFFERQSMLEQATDSFAQVLLDEILGQAKGNEGDPGIWLTHDNAFWEGSFDFKSQAGGEIPHMRFSYNISSGADYDPSAYALYVKGEFLSRDVPAVALWVVTSGDRGIWERARREGA
jgi:hypothetical protein